MPTQKPTKTRVLKQLAALTSLALAFAARGQTASQTTQAISNSLPADLPLIPEDVKLLTESMLWQQNLTVRTGAGWRDNATLSPTNQQASAFLAGGFDCALTRLPLDGLSVDIFVTGDSMRYLQNVPPDGEEFWIASGTVKKTLGDDWLIGFEGQWNYLNQVEYAIFGNGVQNLEVEGDFFRARPFIRRNLGTNAWLQLDFNGAREVIDAPIGNDWRYGPKVTLGLGHEESSEVDLSYEFAAVDSDSLQALESNGTTDQPGTLTLYENDVDLRWHQYWDSDHHWSTETKVGLVLVKDNGGGYYNYDTYSGSERLRFENKNWQITGTARLSPSDFPVQRTDVTTGPLLDIWTVHAGLHAERRLTRWLKLYAEYGYDRAVSNQPSDRYISNVVTAGAIWEF